MMRGEVFAGGKWRCTGLRGFRKQGPGRAAAHEVDRAKRTPKGHDTDQRVFHPGDAGAREVIAMKISASLSALMRRKRLPLCIVPSFTFQRSVPEMGCAPLGKDRTSLDIILDMGIEAHHVSHLAS